MSGQQVTTLRNVKGLAAAWCLSIGIHVAAAIGLALISVAVDLGGTQAAATTDLGAVSLTLTPEPLAKERNPADALAPVPEFEIQDWKEIFAESEEVEVEKPVTEFSDEATFPNSHEPLPRIETSSQPLAVELNVAFVPHPRKAASVPAASQPTAVASVSPVTGSGGGGGGSGVIGVSGSAGSGGGTGGGTGTGHGTGNGSGIGSGSGGGIGNGNAAPAVAARSSSPSGAGAKPPRAKQMDRGSYPSESRRAGEEGTVMLLVEVLTNGKVGSIEIASSSGYASLDRAAREAATHWKFYPAEIAGSAVTSQIRVPYIFRLVDAR